MAGDRVVLRLDGLTRDLGAVRALDGLPFEVPHGQVVGLLGHNGAGKTTTIRILNGLLSPSSGSARALVHDPELVFLDEPTAALDPVAARGVHGLVREHSSEEGRTVVVTTHNLVEAQRLCDHVVILRHGRSIADGSPAQLVAQLAGAGRVEVEVAEGQVEAALASVSAAVAGARASA